MRGVSNFIQMSGPPSWSLVVWDRAFSVAAPTLWKSLPTEICNSLTLERFKSHLKRYLLGTLDPCLFCFVVVGLCLFTL